MSKYFVCCNQCFEAIGKKSTRAAKLWMDLCAMRLSNGEVITVENQDFPELRDLEMLGFIVTTDLLEGLSIHIKGYIHADDGTHFFCIKEGRHE